MEPQACEQTSQLRLWYHELLKGYNTPPHWSRTLFLILLSTIKSGWFEMINWNYRLSRSMCTTKYFNFTNPDRHCKRFDSPISNHHLKISYYSSKWLLSNWFSALENLLQAHYKEYAATDIKGKVTFMQLASMYSPKSPCANWTVNGKKASVHDALAQLVACYRYSIVIITWKHNMHIYECWLQDILATEGQFCTGSLSQLWRVSLLFDLLASQMMQISLGSS